MDKADRKFYEETCQDLRVQLKHWEGSWAASHDGKKPGREDIKNNPDIATKYKKYNRVRDTLSGKIPPPPPKRTAARQHHKEHGSATKRKSEADPLGTTPAKRSKFAQTPSNVRITNMAVTPSISRKLFSPAIPTSIGPTPQRDGKVMGLFDLLNQELANAPVPTPSKATNDGQFLSTPSKGFSDLEEENERLGKTPMSSGRRHYLDMFMTPIKAKDALKEEEDEDDKLDGIARLFQTPEFLKRHQAMPLAGKYKSPSTIKLPPKPAGRSLSSMVASLRQMEDDKLDEEMDVMRDLEEEAFNMSKPATKPSASKELFGGDIPRDSPKPESNKPTEQDMAEEMLIKDSQTLLGGFDDETAYDSPVEEQLDRGRPMRMFKKKGQKRTTRKVNMRPTRTKRPTNMAESDDSDGHGDDNEVVPETQYDASKENIDPAPDIRDFVGDESGSEFGDGAVAVDNTGYDTDAASDEEWGEGRSKKGSAKSKNNDIKNKDKDGIDKKKKKKKNEVVSKKKTAKTKGGKDGGGEDEAEGEGEGKVKRAARKVNELAHANFRALKLRNKGGKAGPGFGSRFRRKR